MSRIEKSMEKAMEMRDAAEKVVSAATAGSPDIKATAAAFRPAEVPLVSPERVDSRLVCIREPESSYAEQYRKLRARIMKSTAGSFLNTIMVTSSNAGEGKTVTAINLAVAIANEIDHTVLLVDADLRNPSVDEYLGLGPGSGLSEYLAGGAEIPDLLVKTGIGKLMVLPAGNVPGNPSELLSSARMKALVEELKNRYKDRYIIFDSVPLLSVADSIPLADYVDGVLMVVQAARTKSEAATRALSLLKGSRMLGVVFNNVPDFIAKKAIADGYYGKAKRASWARRTNE